MLKTIISKLRISIITSVLLLINSVFLQLAVKGNPINVYNNSLLNKNCVSQDSLIYFKIIDSISKETIPFATIIFIENDTNKMSIVSNEDGSFSIPNSSFPKKVKISAVGYEEQLFYLFHVNRLLLKPLKSLLPEIIVRSKAMKSRSANAIIKQVANRFEDNYGNFSFSQNLKFSSVIYNYDTLKEKAEEFVKVYYRNADKSMKSPNWIKDTLYQDKLFTNFIGVSRLCTGDIIPWFDMLRKGLPIDGNNNKGLDFKLISKYKDESRAIIGPFVQKLIAENKKAVMEGGPESAIKVCKDIAPAMAGEAGTVSCATPGCGYHANLSIGGGMKSPSVTGYCRSTKKFVRVKLKSWDDYRKIIPKCPDCPEPIRPIYHGNQVAEIPCPQCGHLTLHYDRRFLFD